MNAPYLRAQAPAGSSLPRRLLLAASLAVTMVLGPAAGLGALSASHAVASHAASAPQMACAAAMSGCAPIRRA